MESVPGTEEELRVDAWEQKSVAEIVADWTNRLRARPWNPLAHIPVAGPHMAQFMHDHLGYHIMKPKQYRHLLRRLRNANSSGPAGCGKTKER